MDLLLYNPHFPMHPSHTADTQAPIPSLDLARQYLSIRDEVLAAIERVCSSQSFILGAEIETLESEIAAFVGAKRAVGCASGTDALWLALASAGIKPGDKVITTPMTFFATGSSIVRAGAEPVFVDVDPKTLNLDPGKVRRVIETGARTANTGMDAPSHTDIKAILPVHLYGQCADMTALQEIADEHRLILIEDAAQAIGAKWKNSGAGSMGASAAFSFYPSKNLGAYGDAGIVTTNDSAMADHMRRLRNHGSPERYLHTEFGWNARMDGIQAAVLRVKLQHIEEWNQRRRTHAETYRRLLDGAGLISGASSTPVRILYCSPDAFHVFHQYVIRVRRRDELRKFLADRGIGSEVYYPIPVHLQPAFAYLGYKEGDLPEAEHAAKDVLALPIFPELTAEEQRRVVAAIAEFYS
jgi:dTDP-4-amino-4,6-dideoxygalactose transaminase